MGSMEGKIEVKENDIIAIFYYNRGKHFAKDCHTHAWRFCS